MKKPYIIFIISLLFLFNNVTAFAQTPPDVFISEYVEGSSNNKALEIYNGTGAAIDLTAGNYVIQMYFNGSATSGNTINLTGTIASGAVFVLANASASFASQPYVNQTNSGSWYNGDDAVVLKKGGASGIIIDAIGQVGFDPGTEWGTGLTSTADNTIRRKASICSGDANASDVFDPSIEWDGFATDDFTGLGMHTSSCTVISGIVLQPQSLSFTTMVGVPSAEQSYTVKGNGLTNDIIVSAPANFEISQVAGGPYNSSITINSADANAAPVPVYIIFNPLAAGLQTGDVLHTSGAFTANLAITGNAISSGITHIFSIQGFTDTSAFAGTTVNTEGIVTGTFQGAGQLGGYFLQDTTGDADTSTSDGIFIFDTSTHVAVGDYVQLTGTVTEYFNKTEIKNITTTSILSSGNSLPAPAPVSLPVTASSDLEKYEGMYVQFPQTLTVSETFNLGRYGELLLSSDGRLFNPTNNIDPNDDPPSGTTSNGNSNVAAITAQQNLNSRREITLDDGSNIQNPAIVPFLNPLDTTLRTGTTTIALTGNLDFSFSEYLIEPTQAPVFDYAQRPLPPNVGLSNVKVSSFNVLNYFNGDGMGGGFPTERGANTLTEFNRQRSKIISAIKNLNADVIGLTEIENDGDGPQSAIADLVSGLNDSTASGTYAYILDPKGANGNSGTDAIKVAMIYKTSIVTPVGLAKADTNSVNNRPPLAQTFTLNNNNEKFTVIINHLKSKGCTGASGSNNDQGDGQGCFNGQRKQQATELLVFIDSLKKSSGVADIISVGDYNAYGEEDPLDILRTGGLTDLLPGSYSYEFDGQSGALDHAFASAFAVPKITGASEWHINADEPVAKDYNQEFNQPYLYSPGPYRSSDHDPVLIGLNLQPCKTDTSVIAIAACSGNLPYYWNGNAHDSAGTYYFDTTNASGCDSVATLILTINPSPVIASLAVGTISCNGGTTFLTVNVSGGKKPYSYSINGSRMVKANSINNIKAGTYTIVVTDAGGCTADTTITITQPAKVRMRVATTKPSCKDNNNGAITVTAAGGVAPYQYSINNSIYGNNNVFTGLVSGSYIIHVKDANGCVSTSTATVPVANNDCPAIVADINNANSNVNAKNAFSIKVLPNPSANNFTLFVNGTGSDKIEISVTDLAGRKIYSASSTENTVFKFGDNFSSGIYVLSVTQGNNQKVIKLIKGK